MPLIAAKAVKGEGKWKPLPKGTYDLTIDAVKERVSGAGNQMLHLEQHVADGNYVGKKAGDFFTLVPKAMWKLKQLLEAAGVDYQEVELEEVNEDGEPLTEIQFDTDDLVGKTYTCDATETIDNKGDPQNRFNNHRPAGGAQPAAAAPAQRQAAPATTTRPAAPAQPAQRQAAPAQQAAAPAAGVQRRTIR